MYRSDYPSLSAVMPDALAETASARPELAEPLDLLSAALDAAPNRRCGCSSCAARRPPSPMEDCLFYRDARLVSLNEVGGEPEPVRGQRAEFHQRAAMRARLWPHAMATLTTHDTKRGEDVRARIGVLSQVPSLWAELVAKWDRRNPAPDPQTGLFLLQNIFGVWPATVW